MKKETGTGKIDVTICTGTTCYVMGASDLLTLEETLPEKILNRVNITGTTCLNLCKNKEDKPPFVMVNEKIISKANLESVKKAIQQELSGEKNANAE
ncbi:MAG: NAD(P)H-dependent oxidoreductase subunit E [Spirochaetales bacterium]|nr:NAD(P)H-dependent oxidoreductase subunit E [Spirochaetales bacterium]